MEKFREEILERTTRKLEEQLVNYLVENTKEMILDLIDDKDANVMEGLDFLYPKYLFINGFINEGDLQEELSHLLIIYKLIPEVDILNVNYKLICIHELLCALDNLTVRDFIKIHNFVYSVKENETNKEILEHIKFKLKTSHNVYR